MSDKKGEPEIVVTATVVSDDEQKHQSGPPIPPGHSRYYCEKCHMHYDLPDQCTSWRCANCQTFNSITPGQCEWCSIL
eukprot:CAMPEP_0185724354 /NCGR_PEP_ID=MMETSP1171-20130828/858_1 /TAXON_ID=374046 /ORGANISM="Helicotheca tamensis, Strain CCMP826" /LENGTH=77 /DNA_ID=CAMNT_0028392183 /DNA_START=37 /DNA_END=270 /DNA_ORIENTATION=-